MVEGALLGGAELAAKEVDARAVVAAAGPGGPTITPLGRWAAQRICADLPALASPRLTAAELITEFARFADEEQQWHVAWGWLAERDPAHAARDILTAAQQMSPLQRLRAVSVAERLGDNALPAWRELTTAPCGGPHARAVLASFDLGPELDEADRRWLAAETAAAALEDKGPDEALSCVSDVMPGDGLDDQLAVVRATGHPGAGELVRAITCMSSGSGRTDTATRSPGSDDSDDEPAQPRRFSLPDVNRKLAALGPRES